MRGDQELRQWVRSHNRRVLLCSAGNIALVGVHFVVCAAVLAGLWAYLAADVPQMNLRLLLAACSAGAAGLILFSALCCLLAGDRPARTLKGSLHNGRTDHWQEELPAENPPTLASFTFPELTLYVLTCCTLGSGKRLLRAIGLLGELHRPEGALLRAVAALMQEVSGSSDRDAWYPVAAYPELLPHLQELLERQVLQGKKADDGGFLVRPTAALRNSLCHSC